MKIAAYCRVSTDKEDQLNSLDAQKRFFVEYAAKNQHDLVQIYADEGISGTKTRNRVQFQKMMADAERGDFEMLVVKDISRLARNTVDLLQSVRRLKALGIRTEFLTANMSSMGDSEFVLTMFGALAQEESANTSKRVKFGKRLNAEKGRVPNLVFGYDKTPGDYFRLDINPDEAEVVRQIYCWYITAGYGGSKIANMLNQRGLKTKRNCDWNQAAVCRILTNPIYIGKVVNGRQEIADFLTSTRVDKEEKDWLIVERPELRIVSDEEFQQAGDLMKARGNAFRLDRTRHSNQYLFSTLIRCKDCGWSFRRVARTYKNTHVRWVCSKHNGQGIHNCPNATSIDENELIEQLDAFFISLVRDRTHLEAQLRKSIREKSMPTDGTEAEIAKIEAEITRLGKRRDRLLDLYADGTIEKEELKRKMDEEADKLRILEEKLLRAKEGALSDEKVDQLAHRLLRDLHSFVSVRNLTNSQLRNLIEKIEVDQNGNVEAFTKAPNQTER